MHLNGGPSILQIIFFMNYFVWKFAGFQDRNKGDIKFLRQQRPKYETPRLGRSKRIDTRVPVMFCNGFYHLPARGGKCQQGCNVLENNSRFREIRYITD